MDEGVGVDGFIEVRKNVLERMVRAMPIDAARSDVFDPPFVLAGTAPGPLGPVAYQVFVTGLALDLTPMTNRATLVLTFTDTSITPLWTNRTAARLTGTVRATVTLVFQQGAPNLPAQLGVNFGAAAVALDPTAASMAEIDKAATPISAEQVREQIRAALEQRLRAQAFLPVALPGAVLPPTAFSENMFTVTSVPTVVFPDPDRLVISLTYTPLTKSVLSLIPSNLAPGPNAIAVTLMPTGFAQVVRNPAVRGSVQTIVADQLRGEFERREWLKRGGRGEITGADRQAAQVELDRFFASPDGIRARDEQTPGPVGAGRMWQPVNPPDPFEKFNAYLYWLDLTLGPGRFNGYLKANGEVYECDFDAQGGFDARPVLANGRIGLADINTHKTNVDIDLPWYIEWAYGILLSVLASPFFGALLVVALNHFADVLAQAVFDQQGLKRSREELQRAGQTLPAMPPSLFLGDVDVSPERMVIHGRWIVNIADPQQFVQTLRIRADAKRSKDPQVLQLPQTAYMKCQGMLGVVAVTDAEHGGTPFQYDVGSWTTTLKLTPEAVNLPLPVVNHAWTVQFGHRSTGQYRFPVMDPAIHQLTAGKLTVTTPVWLPQPVFAGSVQTRTFEVTVKGSDKAWELAFGADAGNLIVQVNTSATDATGTVWRAETVLDVTGRTVTFGPDFLEFKQECDGGRKDFAIPATPDARDPLWNPPEVYFDRLQHAARVRHPGLVSAITAMIEEHGLAEVAALLDPARLQREQR